MNENSIVIEQVNEERKAMRETVDWLRGELEKRHCELRILRELLAKKEAMLTLERNATKKLHGKVAALTQRMVCETHDRLIGLQQLVADEFNEVFEGLGE